MMEAIALWLVVAVACAMLLHPLTRNAAYMIPAGSIFFLFIHYDIAYIPEVRQVGTLLWAAAALLLFSNVRAHIRRRRSA